MAMKTYTRLSFSEREVISQGLWADESLSSIALRLGRRVSTVSQEVKKNCTYRRNYRAVKARNVRLSNVNDRQNQKSWRLTIGCVNTSTNSCGRNGLQKRLPSELNLSTLKIALCASLTKQSISTCTAYPAVN